MANSEVFANGDQSVYGQRLLPHLLREVSKREPQKPWALVFETSDIFKGFRTVNVRDISNAVNATAWWMHNQLGHSDQFETVAYIGISDIRYEIVHLASINCGYKLLCISVRNSDSGYLSLLEATKCTKFICSSELLAKGKHIKDLVPNLQLVQLPSFDEMLSGNIADYPYDKNFAEAENDPVLICHTSGSTGAPKPITLTNGNWAVIDNLRKIPKTLGRKNQDWSLFNYEDRDCFLSSFPPFHATGMIAMALPLLYNSVIVVPPPDRPATGESCLDIMHVLEQHNCTLRGLLVPPTVLEQLVNEPDGLWQTSKLDFVMFTGGPLAPSVGDRLSQVTDICQLIGSTETGPLPGLVPERKNWSYFEWQPFYKIDMEAWADDAFELVIRHDLTLKWIRTVSHTMPHIEVWRTSDLYRQHPENPRLWRFHGRTDDVVVLSNGEKFNPVTMEAIVQGHPLLTGALYYGQGRFQPALLIEPKPATVLLSAESLIDQIWPVIEKANVEAPQHAQIFRHKVAIAMPSKPFRRAAKGTVIRKLTLGDYSTEIEALYSSAVTDTPQNVSNLEAPEDLEAVKEYVRSSLSGHLPQQPTSDGEDLFTLGLDSLQTLEFTNKLKAGLSSHLEVQGMTNITAKQVYANPSIGSLSGFLYGLLNPECGSPNMMIGNDNMNREALMARLVDKYTQGLPEENEKAALSNRSLPSREMNGEGSGAQSSSSLSLAVTGTTGSLGTYLLLALLKDPRVTRVYCLNRGSDAKARQRTTFTSINAEQDANDARLIYLQVDLSQERFGLQPEVFSDLLADTDVIIHNAWKVDFNHTIESFEPQIAGVRRIINFSRNSCRNPHIMFVSSVSSVGSWAAVYGAHRAVPESSLEDYSVAQSQGYGESKHVAERILQNAAERCVTPVTILRVGQIAGPLHGAGSWNESEWLPSLVRTSKELGLIPDSLPDVDWIPVNCVADIVLDILHAGRPQTIRSLNTVNPRTVEWSSLVPVIQNWFKLKKIRAVPLADWISALRSVDLTDQNEVKTKPAVKILDFFDGIEQAGDRQPVYDTAKGAALSKSMAELPPVSGEWMRTWLKQWDF
ncbi:putative NRPS-like protein biosynthetic cluster [Cryomyces antarcticus]|uniref:NRPS-like protein biosynthetic cluster n=1 Tax=Cryomyces antarcticus TaxID=329879 RepID=A0ABR0KUF7_9PEZI|nr:hypothetical protein LTR39_000639 [Cryomyces antarcticus]KAK5131516.1 putative NRPS-like protein biosynthetic cluster [Cryomyces antarcticus]